MTVAVKLSVESLSAQLTEILLPYPIVLAYLYGSVATGRVTPLSDVDIALVVDETRFSLSERLRLELTVAGKIADRFDLADPDVRAINDAPVPFRGQVVAEGKLLFAADEAARVEFESKALDDCFDFRPADDFLREMFFDSLLNGGRTMVNLQKLEGLLRNLKDSTDQLKRLARTEREDFLADNTQIAAAKYCLQVSIEACLDIGNHIIAAHNYRKPKDYKNIFTVLNENGVIPDDFTATLKQMAGLRNRLVHLYWEVDSAEVHKILQEDLDDFDRYARHILEFVKQQRGENDE